MRTRFTLLCFINIFFAIALIQAQVNKPLWRESSLTADDLSRWKFWGLGEIQKFGTQTCLKEADTSKGVTLVSPDVYPANTVLKYKIMALTPATVFIAMVSISDTSSGRLTIPETYDGGMDIWNKEKSSYFIAFKNAPHGSKPFIKKQPGKVERYATQDDKMVAGIYYDVETGCKNNKIWLSIDGKKIIEMEDPSPLAGGHLAFRIRGTAGLKAACLIKDVLVLTDRNN